MGDVRGGESIVVLEPVKNAHTFKNKKLKSEKNFYKPFLTRHTSSEILSAVRCLLL